jgi:hypothetical protein
MNREQALSVKIGDRLSPIHLWNNTNSQTKLPNLVRVLDMNSGARSQTGVLFKVQFINGEETYLDAGWFEYPQQTFKVIIAGSRDFKDFYTLATTCDKLLSNKENVEIVSGNARGADKLGEQYANLRGYTLKLFKADWDKDGKKAGFIRNEKMASYANALILFWDGESKGSKHMLDMAKRNGLQCRIVKF